VDAGNQQRILGYFIEEAKEHLETLEKGLLDLPSVVKEPERVNEMFRAAHSVKGGAAMLGFGSIQKTAHRLEDSFKILKEHPINVDQQLETLFLRGYDTLKDLIEQLQSPFGLREEEANKTVQAAEPSFSQLQSYLNRQVTGADEPAAAASPTPSLKQEKTQGKSSPNFASQVMEILKQMLQLFKQQDSPASRQKLQTLCKRLVQLETGNEDWKRLIQVSYKAIANPKNSFQALAPVVIKELKTASDQLQAGNSSALTLSPALQKLTAATPASATSSKSQEKPPVTPPATTPKQITITVEPKSAAKAIVQAFDKPQLVQLVKILAQAARASS
jgi:chemotaxis protein histidine kinase CheA